MMRVPIPARNTRLGRAIAPRTAAHPGKSGFHALVEPRDAFAARAHLARAAERFLDVQCYIWRADYSGNLLFQALHDAAGRGVRVRLLLDDNNTKGLDATLAALDAHANIEVRLFNPFRWRGQRWLGYLTDFSRLNRRMHNKSFTADNQATIIGGRNVGDEYFDAGEGMVFEDLDVLAVGPIVGEVAADFDRYWASASSHPAARVLPAADGPLRIETVAAAASYREAVRNSAFARELLEGRLALEWAPARMVSDDPAKGLGLAASSALLPHQLKELLGDPSSTLDLVSSYFVPAAAGTQTLAGIARSGVRIRILTNSLEATDVAVVHAGYARRRKALLKAGITLYELRRLSPARHKRSRGVGSSASSLHAKTFSVDGTRVFIGSFNFDPRSAELNTEMGFVIESAALAQAIARTLERRVPAEAYEVRLSGTGALHWIERRGADEVRHDIEPGTGFWQRAAIGLLSLLPVEWLL